ncbi:MAG: family 16 glycosylhydrolase [Bacteroidetes bacterium]|nr:family 16 glycosylhydrolase [Bacteroidota bacterium]
MKNITRLTLLIVSLLLIYSCSKSDKSTPKTEPILPTLSIIDVTQARDNKLTTSFRFFINVSSASTQNITFNYTTVGGTAISNNDFTAQSGVVTITAGQTVGYIDVPIRGDSLRQADQYFYVQISSPANATISGTGKAIGTIQNKGNYLPIDNTGYTTPLSYPGYTLVWNDEFEGATLDSKIWNYEVGGGGWGNQELEYYTSSTNNSYLTNGCLVIEARKETIGTNNYTSARLTTQNKKEFTYGRIDIRAKLPVAKGMWPALWMLGSNISMVNWPKCGETDIMELIGSNPKQVIGSVHWAQNDGSSGTINNGYSLSSGDFSDKFHVFSLIWKQNNIQMLVDDQVYMTAKNTDITNGSWPFNSPSFFIFNVAVGGQWPGNPDSSTIFPQRMLVDYVRVFQ